MKELIRYELLKITSKKSVRYTMVILFVILSVLMYRDVQGLSDEQLEGWEGKVDSEVVSQAKKEEQQLLFKLQDRVASKQDEVMLDTYRQIYETYEFKKTRESKLTSLNEQISQHNREGEENFTIRNLMLERSLLSKVSANTIYFDEPAEHMVDYMSTYGFALLGVMILMGLSTIFTQEYETGVHRLLLSSKDGRQKVAHAKLISSLIYVLGLLFSSISFALLFYYLFLGHEGWNASLQSIPGFWDSPYPLELSIYFWVKLLYHSVASVVFSLVVIMISSLCRSSVVSFSLSGSIFLFPLIATKFALLQTDNKFFTSVFEVLTFSPSQIMRVDPLFIEYAAINIGGFPLLYPIFAFFILLLSASVPIFIINKRSKYPSSI
ncbi:ABC transporter permease [Mechercharimyces sp. CAU 1602]|uniref:ABC transporter permease n=1 Tax=Mechercharimyces sp. CAU 1602 TaxID=2973933 RepID=UPI00216268A0|nr:ABC transporter permease [Mechercharimyces sp. CAU 1602]MCS1352593.1 ABC transporter permease [Mechercharimyces sp. CAU 1602]